MYMIMSDFLPGLETSCSIACPTTAARQLEDLGRQYQEPEKWLFSASEDREALGLFSVDAIRTVVNNYEITSPPDHPRYGMPRNIGDPNVFLLNSMLGSLQQGEPLRPDNVTLLVDLAKQREEQSRYFNEFPLTKQQRYAKLAKPLLDDVAISLLDKDPGFAQLEELAIILEGRESPDETLSLARDIVGSLKSIDHVHMTDQAPFLIARQALAACSGPMPYARPRRYWGTARGQVCPNGSPRNMNYFAAEIQAGK
jgi:hypothetical protein